MVQNKFDIVLSVLANNPAFYQQLQDAVEEELAEANDRFNQCAVAALYDKNEVPRACTQGGIYNAWRDIQSRLARYKHK